MVHREWTLAWDTQCHENCSSYIQIFGVTLSDIFIDLVAGRRQYYIIRRMLKSPIIVYRVENNKDINSSEAVLQKNVTKWTQIEYSMSDM